MRTHVLLPAVVVGFVVALGLGVLGGARAADERPEPQEVLRPREGYSFADVAVSANGRFAAFEMGHGIGIADARKGKFLRFTQSAGKTALEITAIAFAGEDGKCLVSRHERDHVRAWTTTSGSRGARLSPTWEKGDTSSHVGARVIAGSPTHREVALAYWERRLEILDPVRARNRAVFELGDDCIPHAVAFSPGGTRVAVVTSAPDDGTRIHVYARGDDGTWALERAIDDFPGADDDALAQRPVQVWSHVAVSDDGATVFAAGAHVRHRTKIQRSQVLRAWSMEEGDRAWNSESDRRLNAVLLAPGRNGLLIGWSDGAAFLDPATGRTRRELAPHPDGHDAFALDATGERVYAVTDHIRSGMLVAWDVPAPDEEAR